MSQSVPLEYHTGCGHPATTVYYCPGSASCSHSTCPCSERTRRNPLDCSPTAFWQEHNGLLSPSSQSSRTGHKYYKVPFRKYNYWWRIMRRKQELRSTESWGKFWFVVLHHPAFISESVGGLVLSRARGYFWQRRPPAFFGNEMNVNTRVSLEINALCQHRSTYNLVGYCDWLMSGASRFLVTPFLLSIVCRNNKCKLFLWCFSRGNMGRILVSAWVYNAHWNNYYYGRIMLNFWCGWLRKIL